MALSDPSFDVAAPPIQAGPIYRAGQENSRVHAIADALPDARYERALVLGAQASLQRKLTPHCGRLEMTLRAFPEAPAAAFDLIILCDALIRLDAAGRDALLTQALHALKPGGHLVLAHWLDEDDADKLAADFIAMAELNVLPVSRRKTPHYRIDVLERA